MHRLHLLRHAKASRDEAFDDHERPLSRRGREEAYRIAADLPATVGGIDLVLCSTALRTRQTAELSLAGSEPRILFEDGLYLANATALLRRLRRIDEVTEAVLLIGHNPGLQELAVALADPASPGYRALAGGKFPTGARASFSIAVPWANLDRLHHLLTDYRTPKSSEQGRTG
jgi:phosphohistidine phosphatase